MSTDKHLSIEEARGRILEGITPISVESVSLYNSYGRVLAENLFAPFAIPPQDNSAMDGYAFSYSDTDNRDFPLTMPVSGEVAAGHIYNGENRKGETLRIMTGAVVPAGCDTVIPFELTSENENTVTFNKTVTKAANIRFKGEDVQAGDLIVRKGTVLRPQDTGMAASMGFDTLKVFRKPLVGIIATGDEIIEAGVQRTEGQIYNINSYTLAGQIKAMGGDVLILGIAGDSRERIISLISEGQSKNVDILITSGGISAGNFDYVKNVLSARGSILFHQVKMRPGKPFSYGRIGETLFFGLPGNPVASMVSTEVFVKPLIKKMGGIGKYNPFYIEAVSLKEIKKRRGFTYFFRIRLTKEGSTYYAELTGSQGSGVLKSMVDGDGLLVLPEDCETIKKGEKIVILPFETLYSS